MFKVKIYGSGEQNGAIQIHKIFQIEDKQIGEYNGSDKLDVAFNLLKFYYPGVIIDPKSVGLLTFYEPSIYYNMYAECYGLDENLKKIWAEHYGENHNEISPVYQKMIRKNAITFLTLNPSLYPKDIDLATRGNKVHPPFGLIDCTDISPNQFYNKFHDIEKILNEPWTAIDLHYIRNSNQKEIEGIFNKNRNFITEQVQITLDIITEIQPTLVIVANKFVETILFNHVGFSSFTRMDENNIFRYKEIPFIIQESRFLGSRRLWVSKSQNALRLKNKMFTEIKRLLIKLKEAEVEKYSNEKNTYIKDGDYELASKARDAERKTKRQLKNSPNYGAKQI